MKKLVLVLTLAAIIATGTAFADGFGIGVHGGYGGIGGGGGLNLAFSSLYIYVDSVFAGSGGMHVSGAVDFLSLLDGKIIDNLGWYIRVGIGASLWGFDDSLGIAAGVRVPIGLSWKPIPLLELFLQALPQISVQVLPEVQLWPNFWGGNIGLRLWL